jgi:hypothetical protein
MKVRRQNARTSICYKSHNPTPKIYGLVAGILRSRSGLGRAETAGRSLRLGESVPRRHQYAVAEAVSRAVGRK